MQLNIDHILTMGKVQQFRERVGIDNVAMPKRDIWQCIFAEFLGTFFLVLIGCGSTFNGGNFGQNTVENVENPEENQTGRELMHVAFAFVFVIIAMATAIGNISGCHINPAVTIPMILTKDIQLIKGLLYCIVQCIGAIVASAVLQGLGMDGSSNLGVTQIAIDTNITVFQGFGMEFLGTFVLVFVVYSVSDPSRKVIGPLGPIIVGFTVGSLVLFAGPWTGAGLNPARCLGPALIKNMWRDHWIYWIGPISGGIVAAITYKYIFHIPSSTIEIEQSQNSINSSRKNDRINRNFDETNFTKNTLTKSKDSVIPDV